MNKIICFSLCLIVAATTGCGKKAVVEERRKGPIEIETTTVQSGFLKRELKLPGEILPYQDVPIYPKIPGFIKWIGVDRGSIVKKGQLLVQMVAPELDAQEQEAHAKQLAATSALDESRRRLESARALKLEAVAKMQADNLTYTRLKEASKTPGVVAQNDVDVAEKTVEADNQIIDSRAQMIKAAQAQTRSAEDAVKAAKDAVQNVKDLRQYLRITAPYNGVITERNMHEGSLAYPPSGAAGYPPMLRIKENSLLRIVIYVPEMATADVVDGTEIKFTVNAFPNRTFTGKVARIAHSLEPSTRTMPVELNYWNTENLLAPGMFPEVHWVMSRPYQTTFVPSSAVAVTLEKPFVIKVKDNKTQWVYVTRGQSMGNTIEVFGDLQPDDKVALHASDEIGNGVACVATVARPPQ
jgi:membrane fusion protein, multidrug efflux system